SNGIYDTYFKEFAFKFNAPFQRTDVYDTSKISGLHVAPTDVVNGDMYYESFTVDTTFLQNYQVHFDLYSEKVKGGGDLDMNQYSPFSNTARSAQFGGSSISSVPVPEPATLTLLGGGIAALLARRRRLRSR